MRSNPTTFMLATPDPSVAIPQGRHQVEGSRFWPPVRDAYPDENIVRISLGILDLNIKIPVAIEDSGIGELELRFAPCAATVFLDQPGVGEFGLRIFIERPHVRVRRGGVEIEIALLDILAMVSFRPTQAKKALLKRSEERR